MFWLHKEKSNVFGLIRINDWWSFSRKVIICTLQCYLLDNPIIIIWWVRISSSNDFKARSRWWVSKVSTTSSEARPTTSSSTTIITSTSKTKIKPPHHSINPSHNLRSRNLNLRAKSYRTRPTRPQKNRSEKHHPSRLINRKRHKTIRFSSPTRFTSTKRIARG